MAAYIDRWWHSADGLRLHYRDYPGPVGETARPPILCLPGLTRNARDFANLAQRLAGQWRVLCPEMRGRSQSQAAPDWQSYHLRQYVADVDALLAQAGIARFVAVGTSLGGLMTLIMAMADASRIAGALINDIGPVLEPEGLARIGGYVGNAGHFRDWMQAAAALAATQASAFPDNSRADWLAMARRVMHETGDGDIVFDYDMQIGEAFARGSAVNADLWPGIDALAGRPALLVRGGLSELLSAQTFARMRERLPDALAVTLPRLGHAPTLDEPEVVAAIERWLARVT